VSVPRAAETTGPRPDEQPADGTEGTPPAPTVILLVRHGTTTTTGKELPGRAPGLHLAESGQRQAEDVARRILATTAPRRAGDGTAAPDHDPGGNGHGDRTDRTDGHDHGDGRSGHVGVTATRPGPGAGPADAGQAGAGPADAPASPTAAGAAAAPAGPQGGVAAVYASPLERTRETAAPIAAAVGCEVEVDEGLVELDVGDWTGIALAEAAKRPEWKTIQGYPSGFTFPGGESFVAMQARMVATLDKLRVRHPGQTIVVVSHADPIRAVVAHALGTHLDLFQRIVVSPCSLTAIALGHRGPVVLTVNATGDPSPLVPS
jgi:broad specificity phosphatase PhoE